MCGLKLLLMLFLISEHTCIYFGVLHKYQNDLFIRENLLRTAAALKLSKPTSGMPSGLFSLQVLQRQYNNEAFRDF